MIWDFNKREGLRTWSWSSSRVDLIVIDPEAVALLISLCQRALLISLCQRALPHSEYLYLCLMLRTQAKPLFLVKESELGPNGTLLLPLCWKTTAWLRQWSLILKLGQSIWNAAQWSSLLFRPPGHGCGRRPGRFLPPGRPGQLHGLYQGRCGGHLLGWPSGPQKLSEQQSCWSMGGGAAGEDLLL